MNRLALKLRFCAAFLLLGLWGACHTGRESCFYRKLENNEWHIIDPVIVSPDRLYANKH